MLTPKDALPLSEDMLDALDGDLLWFDTLVSRWIDKARLLESENRKLRDQLELATFQARLNQETIRGRTGS